MPQWNIFPAFQVQSLERGARDPQLRWNGHGNDEKWIGVISDDVYLKNMDNVYWIMNTVHSICFIVHVLFMFHNVDRMIMIIDR
jgi:hypothetical protein